MDIIEAIRSEKVFLPWFKGDLSSWENWLVIMRHSFGLPVEKREDRALIAELTGAPYFERTEQAREVYCLAGRRSGKSSMVACTAVFLACFGDYKKTLRPGENGYIFIIAPGREQARQVKRYCSGILRSSPLLEQFIEKDLTWEILLTTNMVISVQTASFRSTRGFSTAAAIFDELCFLKSDDAMDPDFEIFNAVKSSMINMPNSMIWGISSAFMQRGLMWQKWRDHFGKPKKGGPVFFVAPSELLNPKIDKSEIKKQLREDPSRARSEYFSDWRKDITAYIPAADIERCRIEGRRELEYKPGVEYLAFIDAASGVAGGDSMAMSIAHSEDGKIVQDLIHEAPAPFIPADVVKEFVAIMKRYHLGHGLADSWAMNWVFSDFESRGIILKKSALTKSEIYQNFLPLLLNSKVEILDHLKTISQLGNLTRRAKLGGDTIDHPLGMKDDCCNVLSGSCVAMAEDSEIEAGEVMNYPLEDPIPAADPGEESIDDYEDDFDIGTVGDWADESDLGGIKMERDVGPEERFWNSKLDEWRGGGGQRGAPEHYALGQQIADIVEKKTFFNEADIPKLAGQLKAHKDALYSGVGICIVEYWLSCFGYHHIKALGSWERKGELRKMPGILDPAGKEATRIADLKKERDRDIATWNKDKLVSKASLAGMRATWEATTEAMIRYLQSRPFIPQK